MERLELSQKKSYRQDKQIGKNFKIIQSQTK